MTEDERRKLETRASRERNASRENRPRRSEGTSREARATGERRTSGERRVREENREPRERRVREESQVPRERRVREEARAPRERRVREEGQVPRERRVREENRVPRERRVREESQVPRERRVREESQAARERRVREERVSGEVRPARQSRTLNEEEIRPRTRGTNKKKRQKQIRNIILAIAGGMICLLVFVCYAFMYDTVYKSCVVEAGNVVEASDLQKRGFGAIAFTEDSEVIDTSTLGVYNVTVKKGIFTHTCEVTVQDTKAPTAEGIEKTIGMLTEVTAEDCVKNVSDITILSYEFVTAIDMENFEPQEITIAIEDEGGNVTEVVSTITVSDDIEAPVITAPEVIESPLSEGIAYLQVISAKDDSEYEVELEIENSSVDIDTEGDYVITCTATDWVGNTSSVEVTVTVYKKSTEQETVEGYADAVLAEITDSSMSEYDICYAIFYWCRENIAYSGHSEKGDWVAGAYDGFVYGSGDCYTYFATAKVLLTQAGITNMDIEKIPADTSHYWNLVDIGDGWIHFDTTRRADGTLIFLWNDEKLMEYSNANNLSHNYDPSLYPDII